MAALRCSALLFDLDGVLLDSTAAVERAWLRWAREQGLDPASVIAAAHGRRTVDTIAAVAPALDPVAAALRLEEREADEADGITVYDGVAALLSGLPDDRWAIVTSGSRLLATARMRAAGLPVPEVFVTADDVTAGKPDPSCYRAGAARLGLQASQCVVVEDSPAGVAAGRAAGMRVVAVATTHGKPELVAATVVVEALRDLTVTVAPDGLIVEVPSPAGSARA